MTANLRESRANSGTHRLLIFLLVILGPYVLSYIFFVLHPLIPINLFNLFIITTILPSLYFFYRWAGSQNTIIVVFILAFLILIIESFGVLTGIPYGSFFYSDSLGIKLFGLVPWVVPFAFIPLLLGTFTFATKYVQKPWKIVLLSALLLVIIDLTIDPILVNLGIWIWFTPGIYYGVPFSNFIGWFLTGLVMSSVLILCMKFRYSNTQQIPLFVATSLLFTLAFWSGFALWTMFYIPFINSVFLLGLLLVPFLKYFSNES